MTIWEIIVAISTLIAIFSREIRFARAGTAMSLAMISSCAVQETFTRFAIGIIKITKATRIAIWFLIFFPTFTLSSSFSAVSGRVKIIAITSLKKKKIKFKIKGHSLSQFKKKIHYLLSQTFVALSALPNGR